MEDQNQSPLYWFIGFSFQLSPRLFSADRQEVSVMRSLLRTLSLGLICLLLIASSDPTVNMYGYRGGRSFAAAQSVVIVNANANQSPDSREPGDLAVIMPSNTGHATTTASASSFGTTTQAKSCRWSAFQPVSVQVTKITLKVDWSISGYVSTNAPDFGDNASAYALFHINYSTDNGLTFNGMSKGEASSVFSGGEYKPISDSGSFSVALPASTPINQIVVSDRLYTETSASGAGSAWAEMTATISNVRLEVETASNCIANVPGDKWKGEYFGNTNLQGSPAMVRNDGSGDSLNFNFGGNGPSTECGLGADNFSARWTRVVSLAAGAYRFRVTVDNGARLYIDGQNIIDKWGNQPPNTYNADITLSAGPHEIKLEFVEYGGPAAVSLFWFNTTGVNCLPNAPLPLISSASQTGGRDNIASTAPSQAPKRCGKENSD
jgi:hypothetical protein